MQPGRPELSDRRLRLVIGLAGVALNGVGLYFDPNVRWPLLLLGGAMLVSVAGAWVVDLRRTLSSGDTHPIPPLSPRPFPEELLAPERREWLVDFPPLPHFLRLLHDESLFTMRANALAAEADGRWVVVDAVVNDVLAHDRIELVLRDGARATDQKLIAADLDRPVQAERGDPIRVCGRLRCEDRRSVGLKHCEVLSFTSTRRGEAEFALGWDSLDESA